MKASQVLETHLKRIRVLGGRSESMFSGPAQQVLGP